MEIKVIQKQRVIKRKKWTRVKDKFAQIDY